MIAVRSGRAGRWSRFTPIAFAAAPLAWLGVFFLAPMAVILIVSFQHSSVLTGIGGFAGWSNYAAVFRDPTTAKTLLDTAVITGASMAVMLAIGIPVAYLLAFRARRWELPLLLLFVLADQLNPLVRVYAWRMLLGRQGILNSLLTSTGVVDHPLEILLFSKFAVVLVLSVEYVTYAMIPIYAAFKTIHPGTLEAATDLGARLGSTFRRVLLPLAAPGIFVAIILVGIPMLTEFATPTLVGGTSTYMIGSSIEDQILESGNWGAGAALSFVMLVLSAVLALIAYYLGRLNRLSTA